MMTYIMIGAIGVSAIWTIEDILVGIEEVRLLSIGELICEVIMLVMLVLSIVL